MEIYIGIGDPSVSVITLTSISTCCAHIVDTERNCEFTAISLKERILDINCHRFKLLRRSEAACVVMLPSRKKQYVLLINNYVSSLFIGICARADEKRHHQSYSKASIQKGSAWLKPLKTERNINSAGPKDL